MENQVLKQDVVELGWIDTLSSLMDNRFRIPFTNVRFGVDFLIGLVPYAGDMVSFSISSLLVVAMARHGASGVVLSKMIGNIVLDTLVGSIPIIGDIFDLTYKSNRRNVNLLKEHYHEGDHQGSVWKVLIPILIVLISLFFLMLYLVYKIGAWAIGLI